MNDFVYRYTCKGCGAIREVATLRKQTDAQKRQVRQRYCPICELKKIMKGDEK